MNNMQFDQTWQRQMATALKTYEDFIPYLNRLRASEQEREEVRMILSSNFTRLPKKYLEDLLWSIETQDHNPILDDYPYVKRDRTRELAQIRAFILPKSDSPIWETVIETSLVGNKSLKSTLGIKESKAATFLHGDDEFDKDIISGWTQKYEDRGLLSPMFSCMGHCQWCFRHMGDQYIGEENLDKIFNHIEKSNRIRDVILTGGEPLTLSNKKIGEILERLRKINHVRTIRWHIRAPVFIPERFDDELLEMWRNYTSPGKPMIAITQFIHPNEMSRKCQETCYNIISKAGVPLFNQAPILRRVNDDQETFDKWQRVLFENHVKPYYHIATIIADGHNSRFYVPPEECLSLYYNYRARFDGLGAGSVIVPYMGDNISARVLTETMKKGGFYFRRTKKQILSDPNRK